MHIHAFDIKEIKNILISISFIHRYLSVNLSQVGNQEDSSSEDTSSNGNGGKPALPPRPRSISIDHSAAKYVKFHNFHI